MSQSNGVASRLEAIEARQEEMICALRRLAAGAGLGFDDPPELVALLADLRNALLLRTNEEGALMLAQIREFVSGGAGLQSGTGQAASHVATVLASYSPADVVYRFIREPSPPTDPIREDFVAAVGFVDVSGFTKLSEKLANEYGRQGAELLNTYVNGEGCKPAHCEGSNLFAHCLI